MRYVHHFRGGPYREKIKMKYKLFAEETPDINKEIHTLDPSKVYAYVHCAFIEDYKKYQ